LHKIQVEFGIVSPEEKPVRVMLDGRELQGVRSVEVALDDKGVTIVTITLVASKAQDAPQT
jgi:hypothetical protein